MWWKSITRCLDVRAHSSMTIRNHQIGLRWIDFRQRSQSAGAPSQCQILMVINRFFMKQTTNRSMHGLARALVEIILAIELTGCRSRNNHRQCIRLRFSVNVSMLKFMSNECQWKTSFIIFPLFSAIEWKRTSQMDRRINTPRSCRLHWVFFFASFFGLLDDIVGLDLSSSSLFWFASVIFSSSFYFSF